MYEDEQPSLIDRLRFFLKIFGITFLIAGVGLLLFFSRDKVGKVIPSKSPVKLSGIATPAGNVLGASTKRAADISSQLASDVVGGIGGSLDAAKKQALNMKVSDVVTIVSRAQKIPRDFQNMEKYVNEQVENVLKSKK